MELPLGLRMICFEDLFEDWSLSVKSHTVNGQIFYNFQGQPQGMELMTVSRDFQGGIKAAIVRKFDKDLALSLGSHKFFLKMRQHHNLYRLADRIEYLAVHIRESIPSIAYHFVFKNLKKISFVSNIASAPGGHSPPTVLSLLTEGTMDAQILNAAETLAKKIKGNYTTLRRVLEEREIEIIATWNCKARRGLYVITTGGDIVTFTTNLNGMNPVITNIKAQLERCVIQGQNANGSWHCVSHFLRLVQKAKHEGRGWSLSE